MKKSRKIVALLLTICLFAPSFSLNTAADNDVVTPIANNGGDVVVTLGEEDENNVWVEQGYS